MGRASTHARRRRGGDRGARGGLSAMRGALPVHPPYGAADALAAADLVQSRFGDVKPVAALILGSGLGGLAERITRAERIPFGQIPGFPSATVAGHAGVLISGRLAGRSVLALAGRFHMYEGHAAALAAFPTR